MGFRELPSGSLAAPAAPAKPLVAAAERAAAETKEQARIDNLQPLRSHIERVSGEEAKETAQIIANGEVCVSRRLRLCLVVFGFAAIQSNCSLLPFRSSTGARCWRTRSTTGRRSCSTRMISWRSSTRRTSKSLMMSLSARGELCECVFCR